MDEKAHDWSEYPGPLVPDDELPARGYTLHSFRDDPLTVEVAPGLHAVSPVRLLHDRSTGYDVAIELVALPMSEGRAGRMVCREVIVRQVPGGPEVTSEGLRKIPIGRLVYRATLGNVDAVDEHGQRTGSAGIAPERLARLREAGPVEETLVAVAHLYRLAVVIGDPPGVMVEENFDVSRRTAGRWIALARAGGHLGPAEGPGRAVG